LKPKKKEFQWVKLEMINKHSKGDAIMVSDVGQHQMFTCRYKFNSSKSNVTSGGLGTMGFALQQLLVLKWVCQTGSGCSYR
jgi:acetolactate synthase-1/2/3 large subunit